ncbi:MAG TPA: MBL fold metallo-hydrolase [Balneolaceae bacterium]
MKVIIHQGASTIGGNCVEVQTNNGSILIDAGIPVKSEPRLNKEEFNKIASRVKAIFISHPHPDHYEMLKYLDKDIPVFMSRGCKKIISIAHKFGQTDYNPIAAQLIDRKAVKIPLNTESYLSIKPITVDHSGFDSKAFLITDGKTNLLYSGDIRDHGRKKYLTENLLDKLPGTIDYLILEGTLLSRNYRGIQSEQEVEQKLSKVFEQSESFSIIAFSSQNIDRLVSVYKACLKTHKTLVVDPYTAYILNELKDISENLPQYSWNNMGILFASNSYTQNINKETLYQFAGAKVSKKMIRNNPGKYVLKSNRYVEKMIQKENLLDTATLIYSQWKGYAEGIWLNRTVSHIHCSGHAQTETLENLIKKVNPSTAIPIHTENTAAFEKLVDGKMKILN